MNLLNANTILKPQFRIDGTWSYGAKGSRLGYCRGYIPNFVHLDAKSAREWKSKLDQVKHKYHSSGHETPEDALKCFKEYLLDLFVVESELDSELRDQWCSLKCENVTRRVITIDSPIAKVKNYRWYLCDDHFNRETIDGLFDVEILRDAEIGV
jgi:hypothetical protein